MATEGSGHDQQSWTVQTTATVTSAAALSVCLRLLSRHEKKQALGWDDWLILWSLAWNTLVTSFIYVMVKLGMGLDVDTLEPATVVLITKLLVVTDVLYVWNLVWTKISVVLMYYRIFNIHYFRKWAYLISAFVFLWVICMTFLSLFTCEPVAKLWYPEVPGHCVSQLGIWIANSVSTILSDVAILLLPIRELWKLKLRLSQKLSITAVFSLGFFVTIISAYRISVLLTYSSTDSTYTLARTVGWTAIEISSGIIAACLPTMAPAFWYVARKMSFKRSPPNLWQEQPARASKETRMSDKGALSENGIQSDAAKKRRSLESVYSIPNDLYYFPSPNDFYSPSSDFYSHLYETRVRAGRAELYGDDLPRSPYDYRFSVSTPATEAEENCLSEAEISLQGLVGLGLMGRSHFREGADSWGYFSERGAIRPVVEKVADLGPLYDYRYIASSVVKETGKDVLRESKAPIRNIGGHKSFRQVANRTPHEEMNNMSAVDGEPSYRYGRRGSMSAEEDGLSGDDAPLYSVNPPSLHKSFKQLTNLLPKRYDGNTQDTALLEGDQEVEPKRHV